MTDFPLLDTRAGFVLAGLVVTLVAIALLGVVMANLHSRLQRLEQSSPAGRPADPYARLTGTTFAELVPAEPAAAAPRAAMLLSAGCTSCDRVLEELRAKPPPAPIALLWGDHKPPRLAPLPANVSVRSGGAQLRQRLGIGVTPFALLIGEDGVIVRGFPLTSLDSLIRAMNGSESSSTSMRTAAR